MESSKNSSSLRSSSSMIITTVREPERKVVETGHPLEGPSSSDGLDFSVPSGSHDHSTCNGLPSSGRHSSRPGSPLQTGILPWDRFNNWLYCMCVVTFDIEIGQALETIYPQHVKLTEREVSVYKRFEHKTSNLLSNSSVNCLGIRKRTSVTFPFPTPTQDAWETHNITLG